MRCAVKACERAVGEMEAAMQPGLAPYEIAPALSKLYHTVLEH